MISPVITVTPQTSVRGVAQLLLEKRISGTPVVNAEGKLVGMVSEGDLLHRSEAGTGRRRSWWLGLITGKGTLAGEYVREHGHSVADVMSRKVITASPETPLREVARLLEKNGIKRVPIIENEQLVGIVSRANLIQAVTSAPLELEITPSDQLIREKLTANLRAQSWAELVFINITVTNGVVGLWGVVDSEIERKALKVAAETIPGVIAVDDHLMMRPLGE